MGNYKLAQQRIEPIIEKKIKQHQFITGLLNDVSISKKQYVGFLVQMYHLVRNTPYYLTRAASNCFNDTWLRDWYLELAVEERGHENYCILDLENMGLESDEMVKPLPLNGVQALISHNYYIAQNSPVGLLGFAMATEGMGANLATKVSKVIKDKKLFGKDVNNFLHFHGDADIEHYKMVQEAFDRYSGNEDDYKLMLSVWEYTIHNYSQLFTDACNNNILIEK